MINGDFSEDYLFWISYIDSTDGKEGTYMIKGGTYRGMGTYLRKYDYKTPIRISSPFT